MCALAVGTDCSFGSRVGRPPLRWLRCASRGQVFMGVVVGMLVIDAGFDIVVLSDQAPPAPVIHAVRTGLKVGEMCKNSVLNGHLH